MSSPQMTRMLGCFFPDFPFVAMENLLMVAAAATMPPRPGATGQRRALRCVRDTRAADAVSRESAIVRAGERTSELAGDVVRVPAAAEVVHVVDAHDRRL